MMIDRRTFVAGATLAVVAPIPNMPTRLSLPPAAGTSGVVFLIDGWNIQRDDETTDQMWIKFDRRWRASWR